MKAVFVGISVICLVVFVRADYKVEVQFYRYWNPSHRRGNGECCDGANDCDNFCDNFFKICVLSEEGQCGGQSAPFLVERRDEMLRDIIIRNDDDLMFEEGEEAVQGLPNPVVFNISGPWPGDTQSLLVEVFDADGLGMDTGNIVDDNLQFIGGFIVDLANVSVGNSTGPVQYSNNLGLRVNSVMNTFINISISLRCAEDYYGPECNRLCVAEYSDEGHYTCDSEGFIVCRDGYRNTSSNCTECVPAQGCSEVGGYCEEPGDCICLCRYAGTYCELDLDPCGHTRPCENGATCINTGVGDFNCTCPEGFEGEQCQLIQTDECDPNPCRNGGTCEDLLADYMCTCPTGYTDKNCTEVEDDDDDSGSTAGQIAAGVVVPVFCLAFLIVGLVICLGCCWKRKKKEKVRVTEEGGTSTEEGATSTGEGATSTGEGATSTEEGATSTEEGSRTLEAGNGTSVQPDGGPRVAGELFDNPDYGNGIQETSKIEVDFSEVLELVSPK